MQEENNQNEHDQLYIEQYILGGILRDGKGWDVVADKLTKEHFLTDMHQKIFTAMKVLADTNQPIDIVTVDAELKDLGIGEKTTFHYLASLNQNSIGSANIHIYVSILVKRETVRRLGSVSARIAELSTQSMEPSEMIDRAEGMLFEIRQEQMRGGGGRNATDILADLFNLFDRADNQVTPTGFTDLDQMLNGGMRGGELIVIAGRPGSGKTTIGMNIIEHISTVLKKDSMVYSMEMQDIAIMERLLASIGGINLSHIRHHRSDKVDMAQLASASSRLFENKLRIDATSALRPSELRARARREKRARPDLSVILVDYLQLMRGDRNYESRVSEITEISGALKSLAKELNITVIALSQLNRNSMNRADKKPTMSDLRESGSIEQDSDVVMLVHREEQYDPKPENENIAEIIIDKHRNGETGTFKLSFQKNFNKFTNYSSYYRVFK